MTAYALFHSSELDADQEDDSFADGWYVCASIPEGAIIDHRMRGPIDNEADALAVCLNLELTEP